MPLPTDNSDPTANRLIHRALTASAVFYDMLRDDLLSRLQSRYDKGVPLDDLLWEARSVLYEYMDPLVNLLSDAELAAFIVGAHDIAATAAAAQLLPESPVPTPGDEGVAAPRLPTPERLPATPPPELPSWLPPREPPLVPIEGEAGHFEWGGMRAWLPLVEEAVADLQSRELMTKEEFEQLDYEARERAFTVANVNGMEALEKIRTAVVEAVQDGLGFPAWKELVEEDLETSALGPGRLENVFRTNVNQSYHNARETIAANELIGDQFPYRERLVIADARITPLCEELARAGLQGTAIMRAEDPAWVRYRPLSHFSCRCGVRLMSRRDAARRGIEEAIQWEKEGIPPAVPAYVPEPQLSEEARKLFAAWEGRGGSQGLNLSITANLSIPLTASQ